MSVPETTVHKKARPISCKHDVGAAGKIAPVQAESETHFMKAAPDQQFRSGITTVYAAHVQATLLRGQNIRHFTSPIWLDARACAVRLYFLPGWLFPQAYAGSCLSWP